MFEKGEIILVQKHQRNAIPYNRHTKECSKYYNLFASSKPNLIVFFVAGFSLIIDRIVKRSQRSKSSEKIVCAAGGGGGGLV